MSNKIRDIFNSDSEYNKQFFKVVEQIRQDFINNKMCFVCEHCIDISDDRNTGHLCEHTNKPIPNELTCLCWEQKQE